VYNTSKSTFKDIHILGNFVDNHDNARFLSVNGNINAFKNALAWSMTYPGIPIVYYGDE
jgi:alpha-amylase